MAQDKSKGVWYWSDTFPTLHESTISLFETYSHVPASELQQHVNEVKEKGWAAFKYPCIGGYRFLDFSVSLHPRYADILAKVKSGAKYIDIGCCFGQDLRRLVVDGADSAHLTGVDLEQTFIGYELFKDKETLKSKFYVGDMFDESFLQGQEGQFDIIHMGSFLHLFTYDKQVQLVKKIAKLLVPKKGSIIAGRQVGNPQPGHYESANNSLMYQHNEQSFKEMWTNNVAGEWKVEASVKPWQGVPGRSERPESTSGRITFTVERL